MKTKDIKGIIFDLDGVLLSTDHYHFMAWKELANELEIAFDEKDNEAFRGVSRMDCLELLLRKRPDLKLTDAEKEAYANSKNDRYRTSLGKLTADFVADEVRSTLKELRARGYRLAVGSSSKNTRYILERTELTGFFDDVVDGNDITRSKPDPEVFVKAAKAIGITAEDCAVIEDAEAGLEAAVGGGMLPVAIASAKGSALAKINLEHFADLLNYFQ
ncbi:MAG: beta-phosphoglucomutase [Clostridia bacterium]|nr:beta-phosphoglucomutase [Clostridia bacterium]